MLRCSVYGIYRVCIYCVCIYLMLSWKEIVIFGRIEKSKCVFVSLSLSLFLSPTSVFLSSFISSHLISFSFSLMSLPLSPKLPLPHFSLFHNHQIREREKDFEKEKEKEQEREREREKIFLLIPSFSNFF